MKLTLSCWAWVAIIAISGAIALPQPPSNRPEKRRSPFVARQDRADAVKEAFTFAWNGYHQYAFPNDDLGPVDNSFENPRNSWGASAVDALSTAIVMELAPIVDQIVRYIPTINYDNTSDPVSVFETTIRYLGGMLSGYDLLTGPFTGLNIDRTTVPALLSQSTRLATDLSFAFNTPSGIPVNVVNFDPNSFTSVATNGLATIGTLVLEWTRLSDLTGDPLWAQLTQRAEQYLLNPQPPSAQPFPGLVGTDVYIANGTFADATGGWRGGDDSFYEYLLKMYVYDTSRFTTYRDRWIAAADSSIQYLASHPSSRPDLTFLAAFDGTNLIYESQHLACFDGGNFILGGLTLGQQRYIDFGLQLTASCHATYNSTVTGIGPESFAWLPPSCQNSANKKRTVILDDELAMYATSASCLGSSTALPSAYHHRNGPWSYPYGSSSATRKRSTRTVFTTVTLGTSSSSSSITTTSTESSTAPSSISTPVSRTMTSSTFTASTSSSVTVTSTLSSRSPSTSTSAAPLPITSCTLPAEFASQQAFYDQNGFYITDPTYDLRPEVIESYYYAYRATGDSRYQDWAWDAFLAINSTCRVGSGFSQINNVNVAGGGGFTNVQESFLFAETFKYLYLVQSADGPWQVNFQGRNEFVFNTEAHPLRVRGAPI